MRAPTPGALALVFAGTFGSLGCQDPGSSTAFPSSSGRPLGVQALLVPGGSPCGPSSRSTLSMEASVRDGMAAVQRRLGELGFGPVRLLDDIEPQAVLDAVRAAEPMPLLLLYSGHGALYRAGTQPVGYGRDSAAELDACVPERGARCVSTVCLGEHRLALDALVSAVPSSTPLALIVADACVSAHVDVRAARTDVSVLSLSPHALSQPRTLNERTYVANALPRLESRVADLDCDGSVTDLEFFFWLTSEIDCVESEERRAAGHSRSQDPGARSGSVDPLYELPRPKLRRQVTGRGVLFGGGAVSDGCRPRRLDELAATQAGARARHTDPPAVEVQGAVRPETRLRWKGQPLDHARLIPMPCEAAVGQCFRWE